MSRISVAAFFSFAVLLCSAQFAFAADSTPTNAAGSSDNSCVAGDYSCKAGITNGQPNKDKEGVICMQGKSCNYSCSSVGGGTIPGSCTSQNHCRADATKCSGPTPSGTGSSGTTGSNTTSGTTYELPPVTVTAEDNDTSATEAANSASDQSTGGNPSGGSTSDTSGQPAAGNTNAPGSGNSTPNTAVPEITAWTGNGNSLTAYTNQSLFNQALNALEGNSSAPTSGQTTPAAVPTNEQQYLQTTFDTTPTGTFTNTNSSLQAPNANAPTVSFNNPINLDPTPWSPAAAGSNLGWASQDQLAQIVNCNSCTAQLSTSPLPSGAAPYVIQPAPGQVSPALAAAMNANGGWVSGILGKQPTPEVSISNETPPDTSQPTPTPTPTPTPDNTAASDQTNPANQNASGQQASQQSSASGEAQASVNGPQASQSQPASSNNGQFSQQGANNNQAASQQNQTPPPAQEGSQRANNAGGNSSAQNQGGATGGNQNNSGGSSNNGPSSLIFGLISGLTHAISGSPSTAGQTQVSAPIVAPPNQPIVTSPVQTTNGDNLTPCTPSSTNTQRTQNPCTISSAPPLSGAQVTPLATPQLVSSLATGNSSASGQSTTGSGQGTQTIIPGQTQSQGSTQTNVSIQQTGSSQTSDTSQTSAGQQTAPSQQGNNSQPSKPSTQTGSGSNSGTGSNSSGSSGNGNNTPANPSGTQQGSTGTPSPSGLQQGGTGQAASTPGNSSSLSSSNTNASSQTQSAPTQPTPQNSCGVICTVGKVVAYVVQNPGTLLGISPASATEITQNDINNLRSAARKFENGVQAFANSRASGQATTQGNNTIKAGLAAAHYLQNKLEGTIAGDLAKFQAQSTQLEQAFNTCVPASQPPEMGLGIGQKFCLGGQKVTNVYERTTTDLSTIAGVVETKGRQLVEEVNQTVAKIRPNTGIGDIGSTAPQTQAAPAPQSTGGQSTAGVAQPMQSQAQNPLANQRAQINTSAGKVTAELPGQDQMGPITHDGMPVQRAATEVGETYYTSELTTFDDFKCASGTCPSNQLGIAHRTWPLGSQVEVCNTNNGKCAVTTIIDRGPATWLTNRTIDANVALANAIGLNGKNPATYKLLSVPGVSATAQPSGVALTPCNYKGCASPTPNPQVAAARVPGISALPAGASAPAGAKTFSDPTTGASFACAGDAATCVTSFAQQAALSRLCASNPATCNSTPATYSLRLTGPVQPALEPRQIFSIQSAYGVAGKLAKNPAVPTTAGISSQDFVNKLRAAGVQVQDMSSASLSRYPHGKNQMTALTWHGSGTAGADSGLVRTEISQNNSSLPAAQMVLQRDGTLVLVAPADAVSFHAATTNQLGPGIEIQGLANAGDNPTPAQAAAMQKITSVVMDQLGWEVGTHGAIEPSHKDALEAGPITMAYVYEGVAPGPVPTYQLFDQNGKPVLDPNNQPVTTTQAPDASGKGQFLTNPDGTIQLDENGNPIPVNPVQVAQNPENPDQYTAPDDRPQQPTPSNPWLSRTAGNPYPIQANQNCIVVSTGASIPCQNTSQPQQVVQARPIQASSAAPLAARQPVPQPLPYPRIPTNAARDASTPAPPAGAVAITASPATVKSGGTSKISWSSVGTSACTVTTSSGLTIGTTTKGSVLTPALSTTTRFTAQCKAFASSTVIAASTTVLIQ